MTSEQILIWHDIKPTVLRMLILDYLSKNFTHPTVDELYSRLLKKAPTLSRMTIYNTLNLFCEKKIIKKLNIEEKNIRYDFDTSNHAHLFCENCEKVFDIRIDFHKLCEALELLDYSIEKYELNFKGLCQKCKK